MSRNNVEQLRAALEAFNRTGEIVTAHLAPDFELHQASSIIDTAGVFRGPDALRRALEELEGSFEDLRFEPEQFLVGPGGEVVVLVHVRGRGRGSDIQMDNHIGWVWTFRGDEAVRWVVYEEPVEALEAVGLSEQDAHANP
jgi:ketosteroid isomerase-like protein